MLDLVLHVQRAANAHSSLSIVNKFVIPLQEVNYPKVRLIIIFCCWHLSRDALFMSYFLESMIKRCKMEVEQSNGRTAKFDFQMEVESKYL